MQHQSESRMWTGGCVHGSAGRSPNLARAPSGREVLVEW
jgi:hypothetical protein